MTKAEYPPRTWDEWREFAKIAAADSERDDDYDRIEREIQELECEIAGYEEKIDACQFEIDGLHVRRARIEAEWRKTDDHGESVMSPAQAVILANLAAAKPRAWDEWLPWNQSYERAGRRTELA